MEQKTGGPFCNVPLTEQHRMRCTRIERDCLIVDVEQLFEAVDGLHNALCDVEHNFVVDTHGLRRGTLEVLKRANRVLSTAGMIESAGIDG